MNTIKMFGGAGAAFLLGASLAVAQDASATRSDIRTLPGDTGAVVAANEGTLTAANKASGLIGMDVRNSQNEKLGDIKDLVVDLNSGKLAYAVLSVGGFLGIGDKYIAVPTSELSPSADGKELVLNADKAKIQSAPGFDKNNWPSLGNSAWSSHSTFWTPDRGGVGTPGIVRSGRDADSALKDRDAGSALKDKEMFEGRITAIDRAAGTFTVQGAAGQHQFKLSDRGTSTLGTTANERVNLETLKVGDHVMVRYHNLNGAEVVESVSEAKRPDLTR
jgi:sporulation protein YlmC with PRC-barrel domain